MAHARQRLMRALPGGLALPTLLAVVVGCQCQGNAPPPPPEEPPPTASGAPPDGDGDGAEGEAPASSRGSDASAGTWELLRELPGCDLMHGGLTVDVGTAAMRGRRGYRVRREPVTTVVDAGATYERIHQRRFGYQFWLDRKLEGKRFVEVRLRRLTSRRIIPYLDGRRVGYARLKRLDPQVIRFNGVPEEIGPGRHFLQFDFGGRGDGPRVDLDWIRLGREEAGGASYAAPTLADVIADFELDGQPLRSLALRENSSVRCLLRPGGRARLELSLGFWGRGTGMAEVRVSRHGEAPISIQQTKVAHHKDGKWVPLSIDLAEHAGKIIALELRSLESSKGGRVVFGEPRVVRATPRKERVPEARVVVVVVLGSLRRELVPPWGAIDRFAALGELARESAAFDGYRLTSPVVGTVMATLLSGLAPSAHALEDPAASLSARVPLVSGMIRAEGGRSAFFTGVPSTFEDFGFNRRWDRYRSYSPVNDVAAAQPIVDATRWLEDELSGGDDARRLVVIHARGAHPPWDLNKEEVLDLPPAEYGGILTARRGGIVLRKVRGRSRRSARKLGPEDIIRLHALEDAALAKQGEALRDLIDLLQGKGVWDRTLVVVTTDVAPGDPPSVPYAPAGPLEEDRLLAPLLVRFPGAVLAGKQVRGSVTTADVTRTALEALRAKAAAAVPGRDLYRAGAGVSAVVSTPSVATLRDAYAARLGRWLMTGRLGKTPRLCDVGVDPACLVDMHDEAPLVVQALWRWTHDAMVSESQRLNPPLGRTPAVVGDDTLAALTVWGEF